MPALDCIETLADLLRRFRLRRDRLHCFGSSYGGYVASLLLKLMPNSLHAIAENSGFTAAQPVDMANHEFDAYHWNSIGGMRVPIRDCTIAAHFAPSKTVVRSYHSTEDALIPIAEKRKFWAALGGKVPLRATEVVPAMLDGKLFKTMAHGMDASLIELMADAMRDVPFAGDVAATDFERETERTIVAGDRIYQLRYKPDPGIEIAIAPVS